MSVRAEINDVSVRLGAVQALDGVSLTIEPGQFLALLGPSGSGKTTTLNVLAGFVRPDDGSVTFDGSDTTAVPPHLRDIGIVFQGYALFPHMSVADNVAFPLRMRRVSRAQRAQRVAQALELVGLEDYADRPTTTLSGGQQQRVALARAIVFEPSMLLLDEPLAALDKQLRDSMQLELKRLHQRLGITTVAVTHDQVEALTMADQVAVLRDGGVEQVATPEDLYHFPSTLFVATFLGEANLVKVADGLLAGFGRVAVPHSGTAVIRPEQLTVRTTEPPGEDELSAKGRVEELTFQGARTRMRVRVDAMPELTLTIARPTRPGELSLRPGDAVSVCFDASAIHVVQSVPDDRAATSAEALSHGHDSQ